MEGVGSVVRRKIIEYPGFKGSKPRIDSVPTDVGFCQLNYSKFLILLLLN